MNRNLVLFITLFIFISSDSSETKYWEGLRPTTERESFAIETAIKLYNVTMNLDQKLKTALKRDHYEDIVSKEGVQLKQEMDDLETQLLRFINAIEMAGGVMPKTDNSTNEIDEFSVKMDLEYNTMVKNTKVFTDKLLAALSSVKEDKRKLLDETAKYATLRKAYQDSKWLLEQENIFLRNPDSNAKPFTAFDISVLEVLLGYYKELDAIEDKISPIMDKHNSLIEMDQDSEEYKIIKESKRTVKNVNLLKIVPLLEKNNNMLRNYESILTVEIERALQMNDEYENMRNKIMKIAKDMGEQDGKIRKLSQKFNLFLSRANDEAKKAAKMRDEDIHDHDEL